jgi:hypothetical protein
MKYNQELLNDFCINNDLTLLEDYTIINRNIIIKGKCKNANCNKLFNKTFRVLLKTKNFCNECSVRNGKIKSTSTNIKKYGVEHQSQNEDVKNKMKLTNLAKYGVENPFQNEDIKNKMKITNLAKYDFEYPSKNEDIKNKMKITNLTKYGVENPAQNEYFKNKMKITNLEKYGVEYINQSPYFFEKRYSKSNKIYTLPSGKILNIQGYENFALDILIKLYTEHEILNKRTDMPKLKYEQHNKNHVYFPDFYIPKDNLIIEVKSTYTYKTKLLTNILKAHCVRKLNFNYEIWIFDDKKNLLII